MKRAPQLAALAIAIAVVIVGKHYYRHAGADELAWLLAPTAHLVSAVSGGEFVREAGVGWIDREVMFQIAPVCAGGQFLFAAFVVLSIAWLSHMQTWRGMAKRLVLAGACAYVATLAVNTVRISIAVWMHVARASSDDLHRVEGILVYFGGLCALNAIARWRRSSMPSLMWAIPMAVYLAITLGLPILNGAVARPEFGRHAATVMSICAIMAAGLLARNSMRGAGSGASRSVPREYGGTTHSQWHLLRRPK